MHGYVGYAEPLAAMKKEKKPKEMEHPEKKIKLVELLKEIEKWKLEDKSKFFEKIGESVPIGIRIIIGREEITEAQKIEALRLMNEFHNEMNKIKKSLTSTVGTKFGIERIYDYIKYIANQNEKLISSEIAFCINDAFRVMNFLSAKKNENFNLEPSIYRLFEDEGFEKKLNKFIGEESLNNLEGFILGYFYAIDSNEIRMHGTRAYPNLQSIEDWIKKGKSAKKWKDELKMNSSKNPVKEFLKRYRDEIIELD